MTEGKNHIPRILHQMWLDVKNPSCTEPPEKYKNLNYPQTFREKNPHWEFKFWNQDEIFRLFNDDPFFKNSKYSKYFFELEPIIRKCDFSRWAILYKYGGLYVDLDYICYKNLDPLIRSRKYVFFKHHSLLSRWQDRSITNGVMGCVPHDPFCLYIMDQIILRERNPKNDQVWSNLKLLNAFRVIYTTGPLGLKNYFFTWQQKHKVKDADLFLLTQYVHDAPPLLSHVRYFFNVKKPLFQFSKQEELYLNTFWTQGENWAIKKEL